MTLNRRDFVRLSLGSTAFATAPRLLAQGVSSHTVKPVARPAPSGRPFYAHLVDVASAAGLTAPVIYGGVESKKYILEATGCGCAFIDYDNDGWMDIFLLSGTRLTGDPPGATNRLYKNNRDGTFTDVTEKAGLKAVGWACGVCIGDYNNDGFEDIFCTYFGQNRLYRNNGDGTFTDVTKSAGLLNDQPRWGAGCSFLDYNRDGHLDLFVSNYVRFSFEHAPVPGENVNCNWKGVPVECGPRGLPTGRHSLYRNNGDGTFTDVTQQAGISTATESYGMTVVAADLDEDGWTDIFVACDSTPSLLFMNNHDGTFREEGVLRGVALSDDGMEQAGMGVGVGDYDLDGHLDLFKTHFVEDANGLYHNDGKGNFDDLTRSSRVAVDTRYICWGAGIVDLDNDGYPDLFMVTGNVYPEVERKLPQYANKTPPPAEATEFTFYLRIPGWADHAQVTVNAKALAGATPGQYLPIRRRWSAGDVIRLTVDVVPQVIEANPRVADDSGRVAIQRGPFIYCLEEIDQPSGISLSDVAVNPGRRPAEQFQTEFKNDLLGGMVVLHHTGAVYERGASEKVLYSRYGKEATTRKVPLTFIPYYAWANRQATSMQVWNLLLQA